MLVPAAALSWLSRSAARARAESHSVRSLFLATKDPVVDPATQTFYANVPSAAGAGGNSVTLINPLDGTTGAPVFVCHSRVPAVG